MGGLTQQQRLRYTEDGATWRETEYPYNWTPPVPTNPRWTDMGSYWNSITLAWDYKFDTIYYNVYAAWTGQGKYLRAQTPYNNYTLSMGPDVNHEIWVASVSNRGIESAHSGPHRVRSGHPQASKSGSFTWEGRPAGTNTYRPVDGWGYSGDDVLQGYYSQSNAVAFGTMSYDGPSYTNWVASNWGWDVVANMGYDNTMLYMIRRSGSGGGTQSQTYYVSPAWHGSGGQPPLAGGGTMGSHAANDVGTWDGGIPYHWSKHVLHREDVGQGPCQSYVMYRNDSASYQRMYGRGDHGSACNIYTACSWNFVTQNQQNTTGW